MTERDERFDMLRDQWYGGARRRSREQAATAIMVVGLVLGGTMVIFTLVACAIRWVLS